MTLSGKPPVLSYDQALALLLERSPTLEPQGVNLADALGRVLREEVRADRDQPPFDRSAMDGFAVRSAQVRPGAEFPISGTVPAGAAAGAFQNEMAAGSVAAIATGAPLPRGADAVVPIEQSRVEKTSTPHRVRFEATSIPPGQNVHRQGIDAQRGQVVLAPLTRLGPQHIGIAAAMGVTTLQVTRRPRVTILTTGDEVRPPATATADLQPSHIRSSNGPLLAAFLAALGIPVLAQEHVPDEPEITLAAAREALSHSNLVITIGGVSAGERDYLPSAWRRLGLETLIHGVNIQPGKPVFVARPSEDDPRIVLGLPGNPVSVLCCAHLFLWPILRRMCGEPNPMALPWRSVKLATSVKASAKREVFRGAKLNADGTATVIQWHGSGDLVHTAGADGFVRLPLRDEPVDAGTAVPFLPMAGTDC